MSYLLLTIVSLADAIKIKNIFFKEMYIFYISQEFLIINLRLFSYLSQTL